MNPKSIKVAVVIDALAMGGAEHMLLDLLSHLPKEVFEARVYTIIEQGALAPEFTKLGISVIQIGKPRKWSWKPIRQLRAAWAEWKPDLVHTHLFAGDTYGRLAAWKSKIPVITTEHNMNVDEVGIKRWVRTILAHLNAKIVAVSEAVKDYSVHVEYIPADKIQVIYNGVDVNRFSPKSSVPHSIPVIGMTSRLHPNKGHLFLFEALAKMTDQSWKALIAGDGPERKKLEELAKKLGIFERISFLGAVQNIPEVLQQMDIVVLPTIQEGFGLSAVEAMSMEKSVVAFNTGPMCEVIDDGRTGVLVQTRNVDALADGLRLLLTNPNKRVALGKAARISILQHFTVDQMVKQYVDLYIQVTHV